MFESELRHHDAAHREVITLFPISKMKFDIVITF